MDSWSLTSVMLSQQTEKELGKKKMVIPNKFSGKSEATNP